MTGPREPAPRDANPPCQKRPDIFFPARGNRLGYDEAAKHICNSGQSGAPCPFRKQCHDWALRRVVEGVWGGQDEKERKKEQRMRRIVPELLSIPAINGRAYNNLAEAPTHGSWPGIGRHERNREDLCELCLEFRRAYRRQMEARRADYGALRKCDVCGREMRPQSLPKHRRTMHAEPDQRAS